LTEIISDRPPTGRLCCGPTRPTVLYGQHSVTNWQHKSLWPSVGGPGFYS